MSRMAGGAAAKLSLRYEEWWTCWRVADILEGQASGLRLEPPGVSGEGVEFWVEEADGELWYEQVKESSKPWTVNRLLEAISAVERHLAEGHHVRFVLYPPGLQFKKLCKRARSAVSLEEFKEESLSQDLRRDFAQVLEVWDLPDDRPAPEGGQGPEEATAAAENGRASVERWAWQYLRRLHVVSYSPEELRDYVAVRLRRLVAGDAQQVIYSLRGWFDDQLQQELTANKIWAYLEQQGFGRRLLAGDTTTNDALRETVERHRRRVEGREPSFGLVPQPYADELVAELADGEAQILLVHGEAGVGKSTVVAAALGRLMEDPGWYAGVVSMDVGQDLRTADELGEAHRLAESPAVLLAGVSAGSPAVLAVDQLDAVSLYSGRMPEAFESAREVFEQLKLHPNVRVVVAARTVDLKEDPRLRQLRKEDRVQEFELEQLGREAVQEALRGAGINPGGLAEPTLELLRVPLHLAVFSRLSEEAQTTRYRTLQELYDEFTTERRGKLERDAGLDWPGTVGWLVDYMTNHEVLAVPRARLEDEASLSAVNALVSERVLVESGSQVGFFHETYFDYLFARSFVARERDLRQFLVESGQHLFLRAPTRQVLQHLAAEDRDRFRETIAEVLADSHIRLHLKHVVAGVLAQLDDAQPADWEALEPYAFQENGIATRLRRLLRRPAWLDAADQAGRWQVWLADSTAVDKVIYELIRAADERPARVAELVQPYIGTSEQWREYLQTLIGVSLNPGLVDLAVLLVQEGELDDAYPNRGFWSLIHQLAEKDPQGAARLVGVWLQRQLSRAQQQASPDPFDSDYLAAGSQSGPIVIDKITASAPAAFVDHVLGFIVAVAAGSASSSSGGLRRGRWARPRIDEPHQVDDALFRAAEGALQELAELDAEAGLARARELGSYDVQELRFLACRAYTALDVADEAIEWLLADDANLQLGWASSSRWATHKLIEAASPACSDEHLSQLVDRLVYYAPEWERQPDLRSLRLRGRSEYDLLSAIDPPRRPPLVRRRLAELERKFPTSPPAPPQGAVFSAVESPIGDQPASRMDDENWLQAVGTYTKDETNWNGATPTGGVHELATVLGRQAAEEPERFARLALHFDAETPGRYVTAVVNSVAGEIEVGLLARLCHHAQQIAGSEAGQAVCRAIAEVAEEATTELVDLLEVYAQDPDPEHEPPFPSVDDEPQPDLVTTGMNCVRGRAAGAIARVLFNTDQYVDQLQPAVADLANDPTLAVRTWAAEAVVALLNHRPQDALDLAEQLFSDVDVEIHSSRLARRLLLFALVRQPDRFAPYLSQALAGPDSVAENAGQIWAAALLEGELVETLPAGVASLDDPARGGAAAVFAARPAEALPQLEALFDDPVEEVRKAASSAVLRMEDLDVEQAQQLVDALTDSQAFVEAYDRLFLQLKDRQRLLPEATIAACERAIEEAGSGLGDLRTRHAGASRNLITVVLRLYRQSDEPSVRARCLDVIDRLFALGAYGIDRALTGERGI